MDDRIELLKKMPAFGGLRADSLQLLLGASDEVVADEGAGRGELVTCQLHPVAGISGEADDDCLGELERQLAGFGGSGHGREADVQNESAMGGIPDRWR